MYFIPAENLASCFPQSFKIFILHLATTKWLSGWDVQLTLLILSSKDQRVENVVIPFSLMKSFSFLAASDAVHFRHSYSLN